MRKLTLYTTVGCHLCEHAERLLELADLSYTSVDIEDDLTLIERYGVRIPVVKDNLGRELRWPFDSSMLNRFVSSE